MPNNTKSKKRLSLTSNQLKIIAITVMFFDHLAAVFVPIKSPLSVATLLRIPGRLAAPIMCFTVAEGYHKTSNLKRYMARLFVFALISHFPYSLCFDASFSPLKCTSVMWSLFLGLVALAAVKSEQLNKYLKLPVFALCCLLSVTANWNYVAVIWIVIFGIFHGDFKKQAMGFCISAFLFLLVPTYLSSGFLHVYQVGVFLAVPLLWLYGGRLGKKSRVLSRFFYLFYPLHLLIIYLLRIIFKS